LRLQAATPGGPPHTRSANFSTKKFLGKNFTPLYIRRPRTPIAKPFHLRYPHHMDDSPNPGPSLPTPDSNTPDRYAHLRSPNHKRGRGRPMVRGDKRPGSLAKRYQVPRDRKMTTSLMHELTANVLLEPSPNGKGEARIVRILCALADQAEGGGKFAVSAAELLFDRFAGRVKPAEDTQQEGGRITIEWNGPPLPWMPQPAPAPALQPAPPDEPKKGSSGVAPTVQLADVIDAEVCDVERGEDVEKG